MARDDGGVSTPVVISLNKQPGKRIKELKRGRGKLMDDVNAAVDDVRSRLGADAANKQLVPIVVIYERKRKKRRGGGLGLPLPFGLF
jgi:hypothetical protein